MTITKSKCKTFRYLYFLYTCLKNIMIFGDNQTVIEFFQDGLLVLPKCLTHLVNYNDEITNLINFQEINIRLTAKKYF